jgi:8-oxo-dGTP diphosphatase
MAYTYKYPRPAVTADCVVITRETEPKVLLIQRGDQPFKGGWAFPGGFMNMDETTEQCAVRELEEETGLRLSKVQQIGAYSKVDRDPRGRTITVAYLAIVDEPMAVTGQDDAAKAEWWPLSDLPHLAFDHYDIMQDAIGIYAQAMEANEKTPHDRFKEQKERMHELSKEIREQCAHVQELCNNFTKKQ